MSKRQQTVKIKADLTPSNTSFPVERCHCFYCFFFFTNTASRCSDTDGKITSCLSATLCYMHRRCFMRSCDRTVLIRCVVLLRRRCLIWNRQQSVSSVSLIWTPDYHKHSAADHRPSHMTRIHFREAAESAATGFWLLVRVGKPIRAKRLCNSWANVGISQHRTEWKSLQSCKLGGKEGQWAHSVHQKKCHSHHNAPSKNTEKKLFVSIINFLPSLNWKLTGSRFGFASAPTLRHEKW